MNIPPSSLARFITTAAAATAATDTTLDIDPPSSDISEEMISPIDQSTVDAAMALNAATVRKSDNITPSPQRIAGPLKTPEDWEQPAEDLVMEGNETGSTAFNPTAGNTRD